MHLITRTDPLTRAEAEELLTRLPAEITPGLSERELAGIEARRNFCFAPEHRTLLTTGLPTGPSWPDWRAGPEEDLRGQLFWPTEGLIFDVGHNSFWYPAWGPRPMRSADALDLARQQLAHVPVMVPVFGHRYLPAGPDLTGQPVLSMYQSDIIHYGADLADYLRREFTALPSCNLDSVTTAVPFWRYFLDGDDLGDWYFTSTTQVDRE